MRPYYEVEFRIIVLNTLKTKYIIFKHNDFVIDNNNQLYLSGNGECYCLYVGYSARNQYGLL